MPKPPPIETDHEDGSWFLEAVGAKPQSPRASESLAELERENTLESERPSTDSDITHDEQPAPEVEHVSQTSEFVSFQGDPGTSTSSFDPIPPPPVAPQGVFDVPEPPELPDSDPPTGTMFAPIDETSLSRPLRTKRRFRWPVVFLVLTLIAIAAVAVVWVPRALEQQALTVRQHNYDASLAVRTYIPTSQAALDSITNPASSDDAVNASVSVISSLSSLGSDLDAAASEPLPISIPLVTPDSTSDLESLTQRSTLLAGDTTEIARRLGHGYVYRTSIPELLTPGDLPTEASGSAIDELTIRLASSLADDAGVVADLPDDSAFAPTLALASSTLEQYTQWQRVYLDALTAANDPAITDALDQFDALRDDLARSNTEDLLTLRSELDNRLVSLASGLDSHLADLSR